MRLSSCFFSPCFFLFFLRSSSVIRKVVGSKKRPNKTQILFCFSLSFESSCGCEGGDGEDDDGLKNDFCFSLSRREKKQNEEKEEEEELSLNHFLSRLSLETPDDKEREGDCSSLSLLFQTRKRTMSAPEARGEDVEMLAKWREVREQISGARERERERRRRGEKKRRRRRRRSKKELTFPLCALLFPASLDPRPPHRTRFIPRDYQTRAKRRSGQAETSKNSPPPLFFLFRRATGKNPNALSFFPFRK